MATIADKLTKYRARIQAALELGLEPSEHDVREYTRLAGKVAEYGPDKHYGTREHAKKGARWAGRKLKKTAKYLWEH